VIIRYDFLLKKSIFLNTLDKEKIVKSRDGKDITLFDYEMSHLDGMTGEVTSTTKTKVVKREKTPDFIMLFTAGTPLLRDANLTKREQLILNIILEKYVGFSNRVEISTVLRKNLKSTLSYSDSTVYKGINGLQKKNILVEHTGNDENTIEDAWYLNPHIFGRGHWNDIKKLRYDLQVDFDFERLEAKSSSTRIATYSDAEELLAKNLKEVDRVVTKSEDNNTIDTEIVVDKINQEEIKGNRFSEDIELLKQQNRAKELEIELKKLENQEKKINAEELYAKIEAKKMGIDI